MTTAPLSGEAEFRTRCDAELRRLEYAHADADEAPDARTEAIYASGPVRPVASFRVANPSPATNADAKGQG
jgi:hypothetical protein